MSDEKGEDADVFEHFHKGFQFVEKNYGALTLENKIMLVSYLLSHGTGQLTLFPPGANYQLENGDDSEDVDDLGLPGKKKNISELESLNMFR